MIPSRQNFTGANQLEGKREKSLKDANARRTNEIGQIRINKTKTYISQEIQHIVSRSDSRAMNRCWGIIREVEEMLGHGSEHCLFADT
jgi:hypothetical protein